jgi:hypothetical protein
MTAKRHGLKWARKAKGGVAAKTRYVEVSAVRKLTALFFIVR